MDAVTLSQVITLLNRLTDARAGKLDNLDALISSRAAAATALSTATWTAARAALLDSIGANADAANAAGTANAKLAAALLRLGGGTKNISQGNTNLSYSGQTTIISVSGPGVVNGVMLQTQNQYNSMSSLVVTIDGVTVFSGTPISCLTGWSYSYYWPLYGPFKFSTSFVVTGQTTNNNAGLTLDYKWVIDFLTGVA